LNILITGANRGLGLELVKCAAEKGHFVVAGVRSSDSRQDNLLRIADRHLDRIIVMRIDVTDEGVVSEAAESIRFKGIGLDAIINNAGIVLSRGSSIETLNMEDVKHTFEVNLYGPMRVVKHFLPLMDGAFGAIVNISSEAGSFQRANGKDYPYALSKGGINLFSQQLRSCLLDRNIHVYAVHPGWIKTDMGGEEAPGNPMESARSILELIESKRETEGPYTFVDYSGKPLPI
jgi:NAD(P)-dependent dehydrogenase (short-subunit alcohol dehydrogenase family)